MQAGFIGAGTPLAGPPLSMSLSLAFLGCGSQAVRAQRTPGPAATTDAREPLADTYIADGLRWRGITERVWIVTQEEPWGAHSLVVEMPDSTLVLADTPATHRGTQQLLDWLRQRFGPRALVAINGHFHMDTSAGNAAILAAGGAVYGSDATARLLREQGAELRDSLVESYAGTPHAADFRETEIELPSHTFSLAEGLTLRYGSERVQVIHGGPSHTRDSVAVFFPERGVLFGGCMVIGMDRVGFTGHADLEHWPDAIRRLQELPVRHVIPGHGERFGPAVLDHTLRLLAAYEPRHDR